MPKFVVQGNLGHKLRQAFLMTAEVGRLRAKAKPGFFGLSLHSDWDQTAAANPGSLIPIAVSWHARTSSPRANDQAALLSLPIREFHIRGINEGKA
jgi:hypothetical protein